MEQHVVTGAPASENSDTCHKHYKDWKKSLRKHSNVPDAIVEAVAQKLQFAAARRAPCSAVRDVLGTDTSAAYAVQERTIAARVAGGARVVGRKVGLTSLAVQKQLGVDQPDFGVLLDDMAYTDAERIPLERLLQPKIEAEVGFMLAEDLVNGDLSYRQVHNAVAYAVAALEVVDSRIEGWDITFVDTVADNASSGLFVIGHQRRTLDEFAPVTAQMEMSIDDEVVSSGNGAACLGDPINALRWLAITARDFGEPLLKGQIVLSGALGPMASIKGPCTVRAYIGGLGSVTATFTKE